MLNTQSGVIKLAEIIGQHPVIYNDTLREHGKKYIVEKAWESVVQKANEISNENFTIPDLKTRWKGIRSSYTRYLAKKHQDLAHREYYLCDTLQFLEPFIKPTKFIFNRKDESIEDLSESQNDASQMSDVDEDYDKYFYVNCDNPNIDNNTTTKKDADVLDVKPRFYHEEFPTYDDGPSSRKRTKFENEDDNVDLEFFKSVLPDIKHFSAKEKRKFKIGILKLIDEIDESRSNEIY